MAGVSSKPRVVVGLDFGTTYSGFAFAHVSNPDSVFTHFDYPKAGGSEKPYCKTLTGSYYKKQPGGEWQFKSWGFPARAEYARDLQARRKLLASGPSSDPFQPTVGSYLTRFKLHLASEEMGISSAEALPPGLEVTVPITDYLREMGKHMLNTLQGHYGGQLTKQAIQWCVTLPSIWDNSAKAVMKNCMIDAGLVDGADGSPHPLITVLEPEAASCFCLKTMKEQDLQVGDKLLVADVGGGTSDIVVQEVVSAVNSIYRVKEVTISSGGLCGGTYVDKRFIEFLHKKIGPCFADCISQHFSASSQLLERWEQRKTSFGERTDLGESTDVILPNKLVTMWESYDRRMGNYPRESYDELEISYEEMQSIFDPVVEDNLKLISRQLEQVKGVKVLVVVGGFAGSPYLMDCIRKRFAHVVPQIISPPNPGSAVCQGAVMLALTPDTVMSRVCKKTYGVGFVDKFDKKLDLSKHKVKVDGISKCKNRFDIFVRKGDKVAVDSCFQSTFTPLYHGQTSMTIHLFSTSETNPRYTDGDTVKKEGQIEIDMSMDMELDQARRLTVSLYFGRSSLEIKAEAANFSASSVSLPLVVDFLG